MDGEEVRHAVLDVARPQGQAEGRRAAVVGAAELRRRCVRRRLRVMPRRVLGLATPVCEGWGGSESERARE